MVGYRPPLGFSQLWEIATRSGPALKGASRLAHSAKPPPAFHAQPTAFGAAPVRTARESVHSFLRSVADGVFAPLKVHSSRAHLAPNSFRLPPKPTRAPAYRTSLGGARLGARARPGVPFPSHPAHVGLGAARNFSSAGQGTFRNVLSNVPLALRALGGEGLDEAKWRRARRELRRELRTAQKGKGREMCSLERQSMRKAEFAHYFGAVGAAEAECAFARVSSPVVLVLPLEPALDLASAAQSTSERLLPFEVLHSLDVIQQAYASHAKRVRALNERLTRAGVFDDPSTRAELQFVSDGRKQVHLTFGPKWTQNDVLQAAGAWNGGQGEWWYLEDGASSTQSSALADEDLERMEHDLLSQTLRLPTAELDFSSYASSSHSDSASLSSGSRSDEEPRSTLAQMDALRSLAPSPTFSEQSATDVWGDWEHPPFQDLSPALQAEDDHWSVRFEEESSDEEERWSASAHESELRGFLSEVDAVRAVEGPVMFARM